MSWKLEPKTKKIPTLNNPILVEGLPGIGNVGKVVVDFMASELKAKKLYSLTSFDMPHSVFVNERNLVELPSIEVYYVSFGTKKRDLILLTGDIQPIDERSSYEFCKTILDMLEELGGTELITIGGIGLSEVPKSPKVYGTGNSKRIVQKYKKDTKLDDKLYGIVGPIIGVSGLLVGLSAKRKLDAICLLAETLGHPAYLGVKGAREVLKILMKKLSLKMSLKELDKEITEMENEMMLRSEISDITKKKGKITVAEETNYIG